VLCGKWLLENSVWCCKFKYQASTKEYFNPACIPCDKYGNDPVGFSELRIFMWDQAARHEVYLNPS
jgi:hypothetical protein